MAYIHYFREITANDVDKVGVKGVNIASLSPHVKVPPGFVISTKAYIDFLQKAKLKKKIETALQKLDFKNTQKVANQIQKVIVEAKMSVEISEEILEAYEALWFDSKGADNLIEETKEANVSVRSSYVKEKKIEGLSQLTFLNIEGKERLIKAIKVCYAAQFTAQNIEANKNLDGMAIVVQKMVDAQKSVQSFSYNPNNNDSSVLFIEAIFGLGEGFTLRDTVFDVYTVDKKNLDIKDMLVAEQSKKRVLDPETKKTISILLKDSGKKQKLNDIEVREVARLTKKIATLFDSEQRVEIAIKGEEFFVLQSKKVSGKISVEEPEDVKIQEFDTEKTEEVADSDVEIVAPKEDYLETLSDEVTDLQAPLEKDEKVSFDEEEEPRVEVEKQEVPQEDKIDLTFFEEDKTDDDFKIRDEPEPKPFLEEGEEFEESPAQEEQSSETDSADKSEPEEESDDSIFSSFKSGDDDQEEDDEQEEEKDESPFDRFGTE